MFRFERSYRQALFMAALLANARDGEKFARWMGRALSMHEKWALDRA
jgi:hypothetical protein